MQGDVPMEPRNEEQMADVHAGACGEDGRQHDENRMRDTHEEQSVGRDRISERRVEQVVHVPS